MSVCQLCPRNCLIDRKNKIGFCGVNDAIKIAKADLHYWEEPCISGENGSGTIFFSGCSLGCVFCQNSVISHNRFGEEITDERFYEILFELQDKKANNINLVTADHFIDRLIPIIKKAKNNGLCLPIVLNTSSYLKENVVKSLIDIIDVFIADFKFFSPSVAKKYAGAAEYPCLAKSTIDIIYKNIGENKYVNNLLVKGLIVRVLVLPDNIIDAKLTLKYLLDRYGDSICISIMNQFTPVLKCEYPELMRSLTDYEYKSVVDFAISHGLKNGFIQEKGTDISNYIPDFDLKGVRRC